MEHCMINGERCHDCCKVIRIVANQGYKNFVRKFPDNRADWDLSDYSDERQKIADMLIPIKKRRAKKINPQMFKYKDKGLRKWAQKASHFLCKHLVNGVCTNYENRPGMCSGYPYYGKTKEEFLSTSGVGEYNPDCTWFINDLDIK